MRLELGVNFFDVAPGYGHGKAEEVLGRALHGRQEPVVVATKVRLAAEEMHDVAGAVRTSVEASLRRLRRETVDVLHVHNRFTPRRGDLPHSLSADDALGPVLDAYQQMQHTGKTRFIGISAMEPDVPTVRRIMHSGHFDTVLAYYNLLNWTAQEPAPPGVSLWDNGQIIPLATSLNIGVIGIRSHAAGALSQQVDRPIPPGTLLAHDVASAQTLGFLLEGPIRTLSQAAMVFCLMNRDIADHRAWREKCGGDGRTGGVCRPAPDSAAASHALTGTLRPWLPRLKHSPMGHKVTKERSAISIDRFL